MRVCRVRPDVPALDRAFDYAVPETMAAAVAVGTVVRVPLHGRRVRGWVIEDAVAPATEPARLRPLHAVVSAGPPPEVVELATWGAWRFGGSVVPLLRAASPPNVVAPGPVARVEPASPAPPEVPPPAPVREAVASPVGVVAWPPAADRRALVAGLLADSGSTVVVVPDAARTAVLVRELERRGRRPVVLRADRSDSERTAAWQAARAGECVVVGGRLAVLAPVPDLAALVVLDEGDESLKEERAPTWHARELAVERARRAGARVTLVSPAPTLEARAAGGEPLRPPRALERDGWPLLEVVDRREEPPGSGLLGARLATALHRAVDGEGRAVCVLNRRGRARLLVCAACGDPACCEACGGAVEETTGEPAAALACPRCGATRPRLCLGCGSGRLKALRPGVGRVRDDLAALLPRWTVAEVTGTSGDVPPADVLVGTEAVLHRVPRLPGRPVVLVAFLELDQELLAARYRAAEQALWLLVRAARLVGGRRGPGRVLVQTRMPGHEVLDAVAHADPGRCWPVEAERRKALGYPPFGAMAELAGDDDAVEAAAAALREATGVTVLGPSRGRALARAASVEVLCDALGERLAEARARGRLRVDVDPLRV